MFAFIFSTAGRENYVVIIVRFFLFLLRGSLSAVIMKEHTLLSDRLKSIFHRSKREAIFRLLSIRGSFKSRFGWPWLQLFCVWLCAAHNYPKRNIHEKWHKIHCGFRFRFAFWDFSSPVDSCFKVRCKDLFLNSTASPCRTFLHFVFSFFTRSRMYRWKSLSKTVSVVHVLLL